MNDQNEPTTGQILEQFPKYLAEYLGGFVIGILCDVTLTSLAIASGAIGWLVDWRLGVAVFFLGHFTIRTVNAFTQATIVSGRAIANGIHRLAVLFTPPPNSPPRDPSEDEDPVA